ncbi:hypothetical protein ABZ744_32150, partial [Micromonospora chersina]|uniref:hypothetical protein n=1 Tax=Micromonospora chersina TaxID=47854 RepID=UPI0034083193
MSVDEEQARRRSCHGSDSSPWARHPGGRRHREKRRPAAPGGQTAAAQAKQFGYNNDFVGVLPIDRKRALL